MTPIEAPPANVLLWDEDSHLAPPVASNVANVMVDPTYGIIITFGFASVPLQTGDQELDAERLNLRGNPTTVTGRILLSAPTAATLVKIISDGLETIANMPTPEVVAVVQAPQRPKSSVKSKR